MALKYPMKLTLDEDYILPVVWKTKINGVKTPVDLTDYTITLAFYNSSTEPLLEIVCNKTNATGQIEVFLSADDIADLPEGVQTYKLKASGAANRVLIGGKVTVVLM